MKKLYGWRAIAIALTATAAPLCSALESEIGPVAITLNNRFSVGAMWRTEAPDPALIAKLNLQENIDNNLCAGNDCISFSGDPGPNQSLVDAPGAFFGHIQDDGNLNYDQGDVVAAAAKLVNDLSIGWGDYSLKLRGIGFFDPVNTGFENYHPNPRTDPVNNERLQPESTPRDANVTSLVGEHYDLEDAYVSGSWFLGSRSLSASVGWQKIRWGEANLIALNSINEINPPDARRLHMPGGQINEVFQPVNMVVLSGDVFPDQGITAEAFYQLEWKPVQADPGGAFFGDVDVLYTENAYGLIALGQFPEDPYRRNRLQDDTARLLTDTSFSGTVLPQNQGYARDDGQYGLRVNWFADFINNGTEFGFYAMNYHSRFPYLSVYATDHSCLRDAQTPVLAELYTACNGFNGSLNPAGAGNGGEPLPIDTLQILIDYPEDIQMYGLSFNTNIGKWSVAGEYSFRPNLPVQVSVPDVVFAGLQPAFPEEDIVIGADGLVPVSGGGLAPIDSLIGGAAGAGGANFPITVPGARHAAPDFIETRYRGHTVQEHDFIRGYERLQVGQFAMTGIRIIGSSNWINAEQIIFLGEVGVTHVLDLPPLEEIQFDGGSPNRTHYSPGADGTGNNGVTDSRTFNPTQQTEAFVDQVAWGYRLLAQLEYNDVIFGLNFKPFAIFAHDVDGFAPGPMQNFIEGRIEVQAGTEAFYGQNWAFKLQYNYLDGTRHFSKRDRDNVLLEMAYTF